jgi:excisionase family DNA binding protein
MRHMGSKDRSLTPLAVSPAAAARLVGLGRTTLYKALTSGALPSFRIGSRRLILVADLMAWLEAHAVKAPHSANRRSQPGESVDPPGRVSAQTVFQRRE